MSNQRDLQRPVAVYHIRLLVLVVRHRSVPRQLLLGNLKAFSSRNSKLIEIGAAVHYCDASFLAHFLKFFIVLQPFTDRISTTTRTNFAMYFRYSIIYSSLLVVIGDYGES